MPVQPAQKTTVLKPLYLAKNLTQLNAEGDKSNDQMEKSTASRLIQSLDTLQSQGMKCATEGDQEKAYLLLYRLIHGLSILRTKKDYNKSQDEYFHKILPTSKIKQVMGKLEQLNTELKARYDEEYPEHSESALMNKVFGVGKSRKSEEREKDTGNIRPINGIRKDLTPPDVLNIVPPESELKDNEKQISVTELKNAIEQKSRRMLIVDCRSSHSYSSSHISHVNCISIPDQILVKGFSAQKIGDALKGYFTDDMGHYDLWNKRESFDNIILYDWSSSWDSRNPDSPISVLYNAITMWDIPRRFKGNPQMLTGGLREVMFKFPMLLTNPVSDLPESNENKPSSSIDLLSSISYPNIKDDDGIQEAAMGRLSLGAQVGSNKPNRSEPSSTQIASNMSNNNSSEVAIKKPLVIPDRSTKPSKIPSKSSFTPEPVNPQTREYSPEPEATPPTSLVNNGKNSNTEVANDDEHEVVIPDRNVKPVRKFQPNVQDDENEEIVTPSISTEKMPLSNGEIRGQDELKSSTAVASNKSAHSHSQATSFDSATNNGPLGFNAMNGDISDKTRKSTIKRSQSLRNLKQVGEEDEISPNKEQTPTFQRSLKPFNNRTPTFEAYASRRRDFQSVRSTQPAVTGLKNLGNTCYMNSIIQCLYSTEQLIEYFTNNAYKKDINCHVKTNGHTTEEFAALIREINFGHRSISLNDFKAATANIIPSSVYGEQQDSHEFLVHLMDCLHEELNRVKKKSPQKEQNNDNFSDEIAASCAWDTFKASNNSIMTDLFYGQQKSCVCCMSCGKRSVTFEPFCILSIPIRGNKRSDIRECLDLYTTEEEVVDYPCAPCRRKVKVTKKIDLWRLPRYLIIHFQRFYNDGFCKKKVTEIDFPLDNLDMSSYIRSKSYYELYGVSNHIGTMEGGHYTAYCKRARSWYECDDSVVRLLGRRQDIVTQNGYIVFYRRCSP